MQLPALRKFLIVVLTVVRVSVVGAQPEADEAASQPSFRGVTVDSRVQAASGIKTQIVEAQIFSKEFAAIGKVVNVEPLLALRSRYQVAQAELKSAQAKLKQTEQNRKRQQELFQGGITAKRSLQELTAQHAVEQALADTAQAKLAAVANEARLNWGDTLAHWMLTDSVAKLQPLLSGRQHLLQITVPVSQLPAGTVGRIFVDAAGNRAQAKTAEFVSKAPQIDATVQGVNYFFLGANDTLQTGMKVTAWLPETGESLSGIGVPESALVWYMDQLFVYVKTENERFRRQQLTAYTPTGNGYLVQEGLQDGDEIVVVGGQSLLSEELRQQIPDEDD